MSTAQIRDSVLKSQNIENRVRRLIESRVQHLQEVGEGKPFWVLHAVPLLQTSTTIDLTRQPVVDRLKTMGAPNGGDPQHCLEGFKVH